MSYGPKVLGIVLAGGEGKRLMPLTADRAKPAVPFGGSYRLIDFVLSNLTNAGFRRICVLTQYKSHSLDRHISTAWRQTAMFGDYITPVPAQQRLGPRWYTGSADAILQSLNLIYDERPDYVMVFGADHVYRMDPRQMLDYHISTGASVTVAGIRQPVELASSFGVIETEGSSTKIKSFLEKPNTPPTIVGSPNESFVSMGNYIFTTTALIEALLLDAENENSLHDMGSNIIPMLTERGESFVYDFADNKVPGATERDSGYWRDVGTLDSYHEAHMDLVSVHPIFNLYNSKWPIMSYIPPLPPAKFVEGGTAHESIIGAGSIVAGAHVRYSVISVDCTIMEGAYVEGSVLSPGVIVERGAVVRNAILDKNVLVPAGVKLGIDLDADRQRYTTTESGIVAIGKGIEVYR